MDMQAKLNWLASKRVTRESMTSIMDKLFPQKETDGKKESSTRRDNNIAEILSLYDGNSGNAFPEQRGTAYNLWNAVTEYVDHYRSTKGDQRAESASFGNGAKLKDDAMALILKEGLTMPEIVSRGVSVPAESLGLQVRQ